MLAGWLEQTKAVQSTTARQYLEHWYKQLISFVLLPPKSVKAKTAQQLQVWPPISEFVPILVYLGFLVGPDHC